MKTGLIAAAVLLTASPAWAQEAPVWTVTRTPDGMAAEIPLSDGIRMKAQCAAGTLYLLLIDNGRLPGPSVSGRGAGTDNRSPVGQWVRWEESGPLLSRNAAISVRALLTLPEYDVRFRSLRSDGEPVAVHGPLPADDSPLREMLQACGQPLQSDRDFAPPEIRDRMLALRPGEFPRIRHRQPEFPDRALSLGVPRGEAQVSCVMQGAGVRDCRAESEFPAGVGFGQAAVAGMAQSTVSNGVDGGIVVVTVHFVLAN